MTRYVGTGEGAWHGDWYVYTPSVADRIAARELADGIVERIARERTGRRTGYGERLALEPRWYVTGFLGEVAALSLFGSGPENDVWSGRGWHGRPDYGTRTEVRTVSTRQLYTGRQPLGGWRVTAKDAGRVIVCVCERDNGTYAVMGYAEADAIARLPAPVGAIVAVIEPPELTPMHLVTGYVTPPRPSPAVLTRT